MIKMENQLMNKYIVTRDVQENIHKEGNNKSTGKQARESLKNDRLRSLVTGTKIKRR